METPSTVHLASRHPTTTVHRLRDGSEVALLPGGPHTVDLVTGLLEGMSPEARRLRFFAAMPTVPARLVRQLSAADHRDHHLWLATVDGAAVGEVTVARARGATDVAEVAVAVRDDWRRRGIARLLLEVGGVVAAHRGITALRCDVLPENRASAALFRSLGFRFHFADGALAGTGPLPTWTGPASVAEQLRRSTDAVAAALAPPHPEVAVAA